MKRPCGWVSALALLTACSRGHLGRAPTELPEPEPPEDDATESEGMRGDSPDAPAGEEPDERAPGVAFELCRPARPLGVCAGDYAYLRCNDVGDGHTEVACPAETPICTGSGVCEACDASACDVPDVARICRAGRAYSMQCGKDQTCVAEPGGDVGCRGVCRAGSSRCNDTTKNAELCLADGTWQQTDVCDVPAQICRSTEQQAKCIANHSYDAGPYKSSTAPAMPFHPDRDKLYLQAFVPSRTAELVAFRVLGSETATNSTCRFFIFSSTPEGTPLRRIALSAGSASVLRDPNGIVANIPPTLQAGSTYWLGCECNDSSGTPIPLLQKAVPEQAYYVVDHVYGDFLPPDQPITAPRQTGAAFSCFAQVRDVP